ncbi:MULTISPECIES: hypothetical protein [Geobacter]|uniref:Uncharacterized protein n=2 Tax=Geobacter TaxID=28231 RepID=A0A0C1QQE6_9BACT|nr:MULTISPECIES: hypothetical protein [Geobacter]ANA40829.1 hypothetical protein A2G06_11725 [Geobacter anodireducens]KIE42917.1 hypothetical protein SE37_09875 [Geobacter soli]MBE2887055.1 hypothetical protein [Geobacter anodireducens]
MEIFGGMMVMMAILGLFVVAVWLVLPFAVFAVKAKMERALDLLESVEQRLGRVEERLARLEEARGAREPASATPAAPPEETGQESVRP